MCVLIFSATIVWNICYSEKNWVIYDHKCVWVFIQSTFYACEVLTKIEISLQMFEKYSDFKIPENPSSGSRVVPCGRTERETDRHDECNSHFLRFGEHA